MENLPKRIKILGSYYKINYKDEPTHENLGECHPNTDEINIYTKNPSVQRTTVLHEAIEALNTALEWKLKHRIITQLESSLFQIIQDNPKLMKYLGEK